VASDLGHRELALAGLPIEVNSVKFANNETTLRHYEITFV
jgi:hypothetical protein